MKLYPIAQNVNEVETEKARVLFSYKTPVAAFVFGQGYIRTSKKWSVTTSKHINKWLDGEKAQEVPQETLDTLV